MTHPPRRGGIAEKERLLERACGLVGSIDAAMLYGSRARGEATPGSDIDILAVVRDRPGAFTDGDDLAVSAYCAGHLRHLAERGSLFVLHLVHDGEMLHDPDGVLASILAGYKPAEDPERLSAELAVAAAGLLAATPAEREQHGPAMRHLAYYLLRTAVYNKCAASGDPEFDNTAALCAAGLPQLAGLFAARRDAYSDLALRDVLGALPGVVLPHRAQPRANGLVASAVAAAFDWPLASDLLSGVLTGPAVDYTALTLPPA
jgi:hypothetical protein